MNWASHKHRAIDNFFCVCVQFSKPCSPAYSMKNSRLHIPKISNGLVQHVTVEGSTSRQWVKSQLSYPLGHILTLKALITTAADDIHKYFHCFSEKIRFDVSCESSARQRIHLNHQALFSSKDKSKKIKMSSAAIFV